MGSVSHIGTMHMCLIVSSPTPWTPPLGATHRILLHPIMFGSFSNVLNDVSNRTHFYYLCLCATYLPYKHSRSSMINIDGFGFFPFINLHTQRMNISTLTIELITSIMKTSMMECTFAILTSCPSLSIISLPFPSPNDIGLYIYYITELLLISSI